MIRTYTIVRGLAPASAEQFVAMCSTQFPVYGNTAKGTEVPRRLLMKVLGGECALIRSDSFGITTSSGQSCPALTVPQDLPTPKASMLTKGNLYVEYSF